MLNVNSVFDAAVGAYLPPFYSRSKGEALRSFKDAVNNESHEFSKHAADFTLFEFGTFDESTGKFSLHATPMSLGVAIEFRDNVPSLVRTGQAA